MRKTRKRNNKKRKGDGKKEKQKRSSDRRTFKRENCAPGSAKVLKFSCYSPQSLHKLKDLWNGRHKDQKILSNDPREIWQALKYGLSKVCNRESCWLKQKIFKHKLNNEMSDFTFAPVSPKIWEKNPYEWLTSVEMTTVMKQYEKAYPCFEFLGPSPIDFDSHKMYGECVWEEICQFNLKSAIKRGKTKIGLIFNLDPHHLEGSHWICMFINIPKREIYFFDSYGDRPPKQVKKFIKRIKKQSRVLGKEYKVIINTKRHQRSESECGMYCLYMIVELLKGNQTFNELSKTRIPDKRVKILRKVYYNQGIKDKR